MEPKAQGYRVHLYFFAVRMSSKKRVLYGFLVFGECGILSLIALPRPYF